MTKVVKIIALWKMFFFNEVFPRLKENDTRTCQTDPLVLWLHIVREKKTKHPVDPTMRIPALHRSPAAKTKPCEPAGL